MGLNCSSYEHLRTSVPGQTLALVCPNCETIKSLSRNVNMKRLFDSWLTTEGLLSNRKDDRLTDFRPNSWCV